MIEIIYINIDINIHSNPPNSQLKRPKISRGSSEENGFERIYIHLGSFSAQNFRKVEFSNSNELLLGVCVAGIDKELAASTVSKRLTLDIYIYTGAKRVRFKTPRHRK